MDWDDLRYVLAIARAAGLNPAAKALGVNPSSVYRRLEALEARLEVRLFERLRSGYRLTEAGEALAEAATVVGSLPTELADRVERLEVGSIDRIVLLLQGGARVSWGSADQADDKARVLGVLLDQKGPPATSYDVTAPGRPTVRR